jgi:aquaporin rerated protein, other eukaryote
MSKSKSSAILPTHSKQTHPQDDRRLRGFKFAPNWFRNELVAFLGEFAGTFMFLFIAFAATQVANANAPATADNSLTQLPNTSNLMYISLAFGFSLAVNVWAFFRISGGLFNPAVSAICELFISSLTRHPQVTLALFLIGALTPFRAVLVFVAQVVSAICAAAVVDGLFPGPLNVSTSPSAGTTAAQGLFIEMFLTAELVFVIMMLAVEKHKATFLAPLAIGLALFVSELCGVYFTGGSLNPARSFGPAVIVGFKGGHWIYWIGPGLGALLAVGFYKLMKFSEYETANPGQDFNDHEAGMFKPPTDAVTAQEVARPNVAAEQAAELVEAAVLGETSLSEIRSGGSGRARGFSQGSARYNASRGQDGVAVITPSHEKHGSFGTGTVNGKSGPEGDTYLPDGHKTT